MAIARNDPKDRKPFVALENTKDMENRKHEVDTEDRKPDPGTLEQSLVDGKPDHTAESTKILGKLDQLHYQHPAVTLNATFLGI